MKAELGDIKIDADLSKIIKDAIAGIDIDIEIEDDNGTDKVIIKTIK